ncbi:MAG TPA: hypothetical protein PLN74_10370 [Thermomonas sp.]|jgi:hypothetical protein|nr:hypothetical protein [Thermomonas sp.]
MTTNMRSEALKQALGAGDFDVIFGDARGDVGQLAARRRVFVLREGCS